jgi:hypothetical protein
MWCDVASKKGYQKDMSSKAIGLHVEYMIIVAGSTCHNVHICVCVHTWRGRGKWVREELYDHLMSIIILFT